MADGINFHVEAESAEHMLAALQRAMLPSSLEEFLAGPVNKHLEDEADRRFSSEGDTASGKWRELAPYTLEDRARKGFPAGPINVRQGGLHALLTQQGGQSEPTVEGASLHFPGPASGNDEAKLQTAQQGMDPNRIPGFAPVPARPVAALGENDVVEISALFKVYLEDVMNAL